VADPLDIVRAAEAVVPVAAAQLRAADAEVRGRALEAIQLAATTLADKVKDPELANEPPPADQEVKEENLQPLANVLDEAAPAVAGQLAREPEIRARAARTLEEIGRGWLRLQRRAASVAGGGQEEATGPAAPRGIAATPWAFLVAQRRANLRPTQSLPKGLTAALPKLEAALADDDVRVRQAAIDAIENYDAEAGGAVKGLVRALADSDRFVRWVAARTLGRVPTATAAAGGIGLTRLLGDEDLDVRIAAALTLERLGPASAKAIPAISEAIGRGDVEGRVAAIGALVATERAEARGIRALTQQLAHDDARVRRAAAKALGRFSTAARGAAPALKAAFAAAEQALFRALDDEDAEVRRAAADALANLLPTPGER